MHKLHRTCSRLKALATWSFRVAEAVTNSCRGCRAVPGCAIAACLPSIHCLNRRCTTQVVLPETGQPHNSSRAVVGYMQTTRTPHTWSCLQCTNSTRAARHWFATYKRHNSLLPRMWLPIHEQHSNTSSGVLAVFCITCHLCCCVC
jgi:hypothetical protein